MIAYGPVPSRRLGRSLGINNIPPKSCTYACTYCQVGHTRDMSAYRREFYDPKWLVDQVSERVTEVDRAGEKIDYLSFVPDGEPTLDIHLGKEIAALRRLDLPIAVITNGSLVTRPDVRKELATADWVSLKVDSVDERTWRQLDRPHRSLDLQSILDGMMAFRAEFCGILVTETMLVAGVNDTEEHAEATADFLERLKPDTAYVSVPTRPPTRKDVRAASGAAVVRYHERMASRLDRVECLIGYEGNQFAAVGDPISNLLSITAVHPMRHEAVADLLERADAPWSLVEELVAEGRLLVVESSGHTYYLRRPRAS
ncbi:MAG: radical SAM protein [Coriobacteriia bacterium]|nr:radical SAM protein [Coriobacteriia bacterium]MBN2822295.1 radical SAM protein [Coriobacteriia bacterium]